MKIAILNKITCPDIEFKAVGGNADIVCLDAKSEDGLLDKDLSIFDSVITSYKFRVSRLLIDKLDNCKSIVCASVGYDNVDYQYAFEKGIRVFNVPDYGTNDVADHTMALLLSYARRITAYDSYIKKDIVGNWNPLKVTTFHRLSGRHIGIIGLGRIGTAVALRAKAFGMKVSYYDPYKPNGYDKTFGFVNCATLSDLIKDIDILSIHAPLTSETEKMINWDIINEAKNKPIIINTARGKIVDNISIYRALKEGIIESFLADVLEFEPPHKDEELMMLQKDISFSERVIITPHAASYAEESQYEMRYKAAQHAYMSITNSGYRCDCINCME